MNLKLIRIANRVNELELHWRVAILAIIIAGAAYASVRWLIQPLQVELRAMKSDIQAEQQATEELIGKLKSHTNIAEGNDASGLKEKIGKQKDELAKLLGEQGRQRKQLVTLRDKSLILERLTGGNGKVDMISVEQLAPKVYSPSQASVVSTVAAVLAAPASSNVAAPPAIPAEITYRHGLHVVLRGGYFDLLEHLQKLQDLPFQIFWGPLELKAERYPYSILDVTLTVLSKEK